jgi:hypothetical protein
VSHKCKIALSIVQGAHNAVSFGFLNNQTITCDVKGDESPFVTAVRLAKKYIDVDTNWLDIKKVSFYSSLVKPEVVDAKTGKAVGETENFTYLLFRARISRSVKTSEEINWIHSSNHDDLMKIPLMKLHLDSLLI